MMGKWVYLQSSELSIYIPVVVMYHDISNDKLEIWIFITGFL